MNIGMLWFDNDPKVGLETKIERAASYYLKKYGKNPDLCYVHPSMLSTETPPLSPIEVRPNQAVLPHHFWIGVHQPGASLPQAG